MKNNSHSLLNKNLWLYFFSFIIAPTGYIVKIIISGDISVESLGLLYGIISFVTILSSYNDLGMTESMNYFLPDYLRKKDKNNTTRMLMSALWMQMITSCILGILLWFGCDWLSIHYFKDPVAAQLLKVFILFFFWENLFKTLTTFFQAAQNTKLQKWAEFIRMVTLMAYVVALFVLDLGDLLTYAWWWIYALLAGILISIIWMIAGYRDRFSIDGLAFDKQHFKSLMKYAVWVILSANAATLLSQIDMQMILAILGPKDAGYYTNYLSIMRIPFMFLLPGVIFLFPVFSDLFKQQKFKKIIQIRTNAYSYFSSLGIITGFFFLCFWSILSTVLFWATYETSGQILMYSCLFLVFNFLLQIDFQIFSATGRPRQKMIILCIGIFVNFFSNLFLIHYMWVFGAALATGFGWILLWLLSYQRVWKDFKIRFETRFFMKNFIVFLLLSTVLKYFTWGIQLESRIHWLVLIVILWGIYSLSFCALNYQHIHKHLLGSMTKKTIW